MFKERQRKANESILTKSIYMIISHYLLADGGKQKRKTDQNETINNIMKGRSSE
jgi:hypothetical protein